uniref:valine--tRNA ligase n=1 Tax=Tetraselmis chuii TaxID=63592 RepID=A0A7S1X1F6_9CHLO
MFATLEDIMTRFARARGRPTLWLPGTDHAGIATQMVVEKMLAAEGVTRGELGREAFTEKVWEWKREYGSAITGQLRRLGASCDWSREAFTLDDQLSAAVVEAFSRLHDKGLVYRGSYMVNWSPNLQTAVSDLEVEFFDESVELFYFEYPIAGADGESVPVATTRPETILGDTAICVNPDDERYAHLVGKEAEVPMSGGRRIPIIADGYVDAEFGTGCLKITPGHDANDYEIGQRFGLPIINIMNKDASMNAAAGKYEGMDRYECRKALWADMEAAGMAIKREPYQTRVPRSQRGGEVIEPMVSKQWFVKMEPLAKPALEAVERGDIKIVPERFEKVYNFWLENIKDWCISRQLWWGHRIPVWYVFDSADDIVEDGSARYVVARSEAEARAIADEKYGASTVIVQDPDVLDTWFSSGLWPFSTLGWPNESAADLQRFYPTAMLETGHDILFFWVARMVMMGIELTGAAPFHTIFLHGLVRDEKGRKMSKSLGNVVDPLDTIAEYGTDALRFTLATGTTPGQDLNLNMERLTNSRNFVNKIWNAGKFILYNLSDVDDDEWQKLCAVDFSEAAACEGLPLSDRWIIGHLHHTVDRVTVLAEKHDYGEAGRLLYDFAWSDFADWYIESSKAATYSGDADAQASARAVLVYVYTSLLRLLHPFVPFVTEELWGALPHPPGPLITASWPKTAAHVDRTALDDYASLQAVVRAIRNARAEYGVELGKKIAASIVASAPETQARLQAELPVMALLAKLDPSAAQVLGSMPEGGAEGAVGLVVREGLEVLLPLAGLFDAEKERARLLKQSSKLEKSLGGLSARLGNAKFVASAPEAVVAEVRGQVAEAEEQLAMVREKLAQVDAMLAN